MNEKNDFLEFLKSRRSIRKFKEENIAWHDIVKIIDAGRWAPSAGNIQDIRYIIVRDEEKIEQISEACLEQEWIDSANAIIVVCNLPERNKTFYYERGEKIYSIQDGAAAVENMILMAHKLKIGTCWVGAFEEDELKRILNIPDGVQVAAVLPLGYPDEEVPTPPRKALEKIIGFESYGNKVKDVDVYLRDFGKHFDRKLEKLTKKLNKKIQKKHEE